MNDPLDDWLHADDDTGSRFAWSEEMRCGHEEIDADHMHIFSLAEDLRSASVLGREAVVVGRALTELLIYAEEHFQREEELMSQLGYPALTAHQLEHSILIRHVRAIHRQFMDGAAVKRSDVWKFLRRWLRNHITTTDAAFVLFARNQKREVSENGGEHR